jgi:hypothetical protein
MKVKRKTCYNIVFYSFAVFTFVSWIYTISHFIGWIISLF